MATTLTDAQRAELRASLEEKRRKLSASTERDLSVIGSDDEPLADEMEAAARETEETELVGVDANERAMLTEVEHALAKFDDDSYGLSEESGEPIPFARLQAVPWARYLVAEEESIERSR